MGIRTALFIVALGLVSGLIATRPLEPVHASTDLTSSWTFDWNGAPGPSPIPCSSAAVKQHSPDLYIYLTCAPGTLFSGSYDKGAGTFTVTTTVLCKGFIETPFTLTGTVSPDGNSISGAWSTLCIYSIVGLYSADRAGPATVTFTPPATSTPTGTATATATATATCPCAATHSPTPPPAVGGAALDASSPANRAAQLATIGLAALALALAATAAALRTRRASQLSL